MSKKITNDGSHAVCDAVFTASAGMTKIINAYLTRTETIWHFRSVMDLYYLCAVGQREVMPSQQNDQHHRTLSKTTKWKFEMASTKTLSTTLLKTKQPFMVRQFVHFTRAKFCTAAFSQNYIHH